MTQYTRSIRKAAECLRAGGTVAFATETVIGIGADAGNERAVTGIFKAKGRPADNPLIVHLHDVTKLQQIVSALFAATTLAEFRNQCREVLANDPPADGAHFN